MVALPPPKLPEIKLHELMLFRSLIPSEFLAWLLSDSDSSLQILELRDVPGQQIKRIMAEHGRCLQSLHLLRYNKDSADILRLCTLLEELVIFRIPTVIELRDLPPTIEHFSFRDPTNIGFHALILPLIATLPNLRVVTVDENIRQDSHFPALWGTCVAKRVHLRVHLFPVSSSSDPGSDPSKSCLTVIGYSMKTQW